MMTFGGGPAKHAVTPKNRVRRGVLMMSFMLVSQSVVFDQMVGRGETTNVQMLRADMRIGNRKEQADRSSRTVPEFGPLAMARKSAELCCAAPRKQFVFNFLAFQGDDLTCNLLVIY